VASSYAIAHLRPPLSQVQLLEIFQNVSRNFSKSSPKLSRSKKSKVAFCNAKVAQTLLEKTKAFISVFFVARLFLYLV